MSGYTKLFNSILHSTIWQARNETRLVWITMLAMADRRGVVAAAIPGLAAAARVPLKSCITALSELSSPDEYSRTKDHDGRRIEDVDGGWRLLNHTKYRDKLSSDERREYKKIKQREYRQKQRVDTPVDKDSTAGQSGHIATPAPEATTEARSDSKDVLKQREQASSYGSLPVISEENKMQSRRAMADAMRRPYDRKHAGR